MTTATKPALTWGDLKTWAEANSIPDSYPIEDEDGNRPTSFDEDTITEDDEYEGNDPVAVEHVLVIRFQD